MATPEIKVDRQPQDRDMLCQEIARHAVEMFSLAGVESPTDIAYFIQSALSDKDNKER